MLSRLCFDHDAVIMSDFNLSCSRKETRWSAVIFIRDVTSTWLCCTAFSCSTYRHICNVYSDCSFCLFLQKFFWKSYSSQHWVSSRLGLYLFCLHNLFFCKALTTAFCADFSNWIAWGKTLLCEWQCAMKQQLGTRCLTLWGGEGKK